MKISFKNDYSEGCHPNILQALTKCNNTQQDGYGLDKYSKNAEQLILKELNSTTSKVYFVTGGTQANLLVIASILRPFESVVSAETAHIFTNETGAIEATGHKIHGVVTSDGKLKSEHIQQVIDNHPRRPHQLKQKLIFISNATEIGTIYTKKELQQLSEFCKANNMYLYLDGARLAQALTAENNDITFADLAKLVDVFYVGGTKNGALLGEAIVINNPKLQEDFEFNIKQRGAMLAKGRLLGVQFQELFTNNLFFELGKHANVQAMKIKQAFLDKGYKFLSDTTTNQIFPILKQTDIEKLWQDFDFYIWKPLENNKAAVRIITSWATTDKDVSKFVSAINHL